MADSLLDKVRRCARSEGVGHGVDMVLASTILASKDLASAISNLKYLALLKTKPVVRATLRAIIEAGLED